MSRKDTNAAASPPPEPCLSKEQINELFHNCIKLAFKNKINQKNTWELKLIDHLSEIIKVEIEGDTETNFQKASYTLEVGMRIYSARVDAVLSKAYEVLGAINRGGVEDEQVAIPGDDNVRRQHDGNHFKNNLEKKMLSLSTLESSLEAPNTKRHGVAFAVDPLYYHISAQFDEGGAKGLLLNNLGVYGECRVLFDAFEVAGKFKSWSHHNGNQDKIDISFAKESIDKMLENILATNEISPTLREIIRLFDESEIIIPGRNFDVRADGFDTSEVEKDNTSFVNFKAWTSNPDNETNDFHETCACDSFLQSHQKENKSSTTSESSVDEGLESCTTFLFQGLGFTSQTNMWAGPDHWKFQKHKCPESIPVPESGSAFSTKRQKRKNPVETDINFLISLDTERIDIFALPKSPDSLLLSSSPAPFSNMLPEDYHYQPENLVKLFLLPNFLCMEKKKRELIDDKFWQQRDDSDEALPSWDNERVLSGQSDDGCFQGGEDAEELVSQPPKANKIEVQYDRTSKQVDMQALKEMLWDHIQESIEVPETKICEDKVSFKRVLATFHFESRASATKNISPHVSFICLLHLANEHGLSIHDCPSLDDLIVQLPPCRNMDGMAQFSS
ncbi:condensin complex subunit 2-like [Euphorbia lathyris]|uniref:condensin complex subunit 2-like n=1 Tax=Euphorbia lathyris TaxID=212925 RepID=UPI003313A10C